MTKKISGLIVPVLSITFLISCNNNNPSIPETCIVKFDCTDCYAADEQNVKITEKEYKYGSELNFHFTSVRDHLLPTNSEVSITKKGGGDFTNYSYDSETGNLSFTLTSDVTVTASSSRSDKVIYSITLQGDNYLKIQDKVTFVENNFNPISVPYTTENGYTIDHISIYPQSAIEYQYDFNNKIIFVPKNNVNAKVVFVSGKRNVTLSKAETLEITNTTYNENDIEVNVAVKNSYKNKFEMPINKDDFQIEASDSSDVVFTYTRSDANRGTIKINDNTPLKALSFMIFANDYRVRVEVTPVYSEHLTFDVGTSHLADYKKDFTFKISAINVTNSYYYYVPYTLSIELADGTILPSGAYNITALDEERQNATCTIYAQYMVQDFKISGDAAHVDYFESYIYVCGATIEWTGKNEVLEYHKKGEKVDHYFLADVGSARFDANRVIVEDKDGNLYRLSDPDLPDIYKDKIVIPDDTNHLNIMEDADFDYVGVYLVVNNYKAFSGFTWDIISRINERGWMEGFFEVGDTKQITIDNLTYDVRILDFNHDTLQDESGTAAMSLELVQLITNADGSLHKGQFTEYREDYFAGNWYDKYLNGDFFDMLPVDLAPLIKNVKKTYYYVDTDSYDEKTYYPKVFPLSLTEFGVDDVLVVEENSTYAYYDDQDKSLRCKSGVGSTSASTYWTRTVDKNSPSEDYFIQTDGGYKSDDPRDNRGYMAAFCI